MGIPPPGAYCHWQARKSFQGLPKHHTNSWASRRAKLGRKLPPHALSWRSPGFLTWRLGQPPIPIMRTSISFHQRLLTTRSHRRPSRFRRVPHGHQVRAQDRGRRRRRPTEGPDGGEESSPCPAAALGSRRGLADEERSCSPMGEAAGISSSASLSTPKHLNRPLGEEAPPANPLVRTLVRR